MVPRARFEALLWYLSHQQRPVSENSARCGVLAEKGRTQSAVRTLVYCKLEAERRRRPVAVLLTHRVCSLLVVTDSSMDSTLVTVLWCRGYREAQWRGPSSYCEQSMAGFTLPGYGFRLQRRVGARGGQRFLVCCSAPGSSLAPIKRCPSATTRPLLRYPGRP